MTVTTPQLTKHGQCMKRRKDTKMARWPSHTEPCTIPRVAHSIRAIDKDAYEPTMFSISPYHQSNPKLQAMEGHKWRYLQAILRRDKERELTDFLKEMETLEVKVQIQSFSTQENIELESRGFMETRLLDGCFIVELFRNVGSKDDAAESYPKCGSYIMSYAILVNFLVDSPQDVAMLKRYKIIEHRLGKDEGGSSLEPDVHR
ncbi:hypothetical protein AAC387_Pa11g0486 [Persea americana]